jgi:hypothetical protein
LLCIGGAAFLQKLDWWLLTASRGLSAAETELSIALACAVTHSKSLAPRNHAYDMGIDRQIDFADDAHCMRPTLFPSTSSSSLWVRKASRIYPDAFCSAAVWNLGRLLRHRSNSIYTDTALVQL